jgi:uncharacterized membrane protein YvbJ
MKSCPDCLAENQDSSRHCLQCGAKFPSNSATAASSPARQVSAKSRVPIQPVTGENRTQNATATTSRVIITDFEMPFGSMVRFLVKLALASIPAMLILFLILGIISAIFGGIFAGLLSMF